jgi:DNA end-binding protein Ku
MARPVWTGSISFGLVNVPVKAFTAVRDHSIHFHQLDKKTGARVQYKKVSSKSGRALDSDDIEKGYEITKGNYVVVDEEELEELRPRSTKTIDVADFVQLDQIDPIYYEKTYWLAADGEGADRPYRLLLAAMDKAQRVAIGSVVMRNKQYLAAVRPLDGALAMSTMHFADEVVAKSEIDDIPTARTKPSTREVELAGQIIDALTADWNPSKYHDTYTDELQELIEAKAKGKDVTVEPEAEQSSNVIDLMEALQASVEQHRTRSAAKTGSGTSAKPSAKPSAKSGNSSGKRSRTSTVKRTTAKRSHSKRSTSKRKTA